MCSKRLEAKRAAQILGFAFLKNLKTSQLAAEWAVV
jgi:hypothetical protein